MCNLELRYIHWRVIVVFTQNPTFLMFVDINEAPKLSGNVSKHGYLWQFQGCCAGEKYPGFILFGLVFNSLIPGRCNLIFNFSLSNHIRVWYLLFFFCFFYDTVKNQCIAIQLSFPTITLQKIHVIIIFKHILVFLIICAFLVKFNCLRLAHMQLPMPWC